MTIGTIYVGGDLSGLYTGDGNKITGKPHGKSIPRHVQEINSRGLYGQVRTH